MATFICVYGTGREIESGENICRNKKTRMHVELEDFSLLVYECSAFRILGLCLPGQEVMRPSEVSRRLTSSGHSSDETPFHHSGEWIMSQPIRGGE